MLKKGLIHISFKNSDTAVEGLHCVPWQSERETIANINKTEIQDHKTTTWLKLTNNFV